MQVEMAADSILAIVDSDEVPTDVTVTALERLFYRVNEATAQFPQRDVPTTLTSNSRGTDTAGAQRALSFLRMIGFYSVDATSIRLRVLRRLATFDPKAATQLSLTLQHVALPVDTGCESITVAVLDSIDDDKYFETLLAVDPELKLIRQAMSLGSENRGAHIDFSDS